MPDGMWEAAGDALEIGEHAVAPFLVQAGKCGGKEVIIGHNGEIFVQFVLTDRRLPTLIAGPKHLRMLSAFAKQIGMRGGASVRVKQSKSQQIVANADVNALTPLVMSIRGPF